MVVSFIKKVNWRSIGAALFSFLTMLSVAPYTLGDVANLIPPKFKVWVFMASSVAAMILRFSNSVKPKEEEK